MTKLKGISVLCIGVVVLVLMGCNDDQKKQAVDRARQPALVSHRLIGGDSASLPPAYLSVKGFKNCLKTQSYGTWRGWCLPKDRPSSCLKASWKQLQGQADLPSCHKS